MVTCMNWMLNKIDELNKENLSKMGCWFSAPGGLKEYEPEVKFSPQTPLIAVEKRSVEMKCIFSG